MMLFIKDFSRQLDECEDLESLFMLVQDAVERALKIRRDNLSLHFINLPSYIGGFHQVGSDAIGINKGLLKAVLQSCGRKIAKAFLFHILLHEYIHSLGLVDESSTENLSYQISKNLLGEEHPATLMSRYGIASVFYMKEKKKEPKINITFYG